MVLVVGFSSLFFPYGWLIVWFLFVVRFFFMWCLLLDILLNIGFHSSFSNSSFFHMNSQPSLCVCVYVRQAAFHLLFRLLLWLFANLLLHCSVLNSLFDYFQSDFYVFLPWLFRPQYISSHAFTKVSTFKFELYFLILHPFRPILFAYLLARSFALAITQPLNKFSTTSTVCGVSKYIKMLLF